MTVHSVLVMFWILGGLYAANAQVKSSLVIGEDGMTRQLDFPIEGEIFTPSKPARIYNLGLQKIRGSRSRYPAHTLPTCPFPCSAGFHHHPAPGHLIHPPKTHSRGSFICWKSLDDGTMKRQALPGVTPNVAHLALPHPPSRQLPFGFHPTTPFRCRI